VGRELGSRSCPASSATHFLSNFPQLMSLTRPFFFCWSPCLAPTQACEPNRSTCGKRTSDPAPVVACAGSHTAESIAHSRGYRHEHGIDCSCTVSIQAPCTYVPSSYVLPQRRQSKRDAGFFCAGARDGTTLRVPHVPVRNQSYVFSIGRLHSSWAPAWPGSAQCKTDREEKALPPCVNKAA